MQRSNCKTNYLNIRSVLWLYYKILNLDIFPYIHCHFNILLCCILCTDLEWKLIYVGSAEDETYDQLLESVFVGPVNVGNYRFVFQADTPDPSKIREEDIIGVTVLLLTCSYMGQEFIRVGYYVNNDYDDEQLREEPPPRVLIDRVRKNILADKPRVTKFPINFHPETNESSEPPPPPLHDHIDDDQDP
ncbi:probable histone chaperone ASF1A isoform X1 [Macadamia integrifolia]|uniref:probable histone chaperone ASF1A isoform X1 n=1 Tax=Macadamia integrifolia TaxID=60698 RepID=UPI001C4F5807|nr:probable histone chaperone ASF1A isoform X1 [Macadamia integrifolia]